MKNLAMGRYVAYGSFIHKLDPRNKILLTILAIVCVFLPFSGYANNGCCEDVGNFGDYWTSTAALNDGIRESSSFYIGVGASNEYWASYCSRCYGFAIRPVFQESEANK
jgi:hypothetical protein